MRLIDADKLGIGKANPDVFEHKEYAYGLNSAIQIINNAPTINSVFIDEYNEVKKEIELIKKRTRCINS